MYTGGGARLRLADPRLLSVSPAGTNRLLPIRRAGADGDFAAAEQFEVFAALDVDGARAGARADDGADGRALTAARDGADDGADRRADGRALRGRGATAVVVAHGAL